MDPALEVAQASEGIMVLVGQEYCCYGLKKRKSPLKIEIHSEGQVTKGFSI